MVLEKECLLQAGEKSFQEEELKVERSFQFHQKAVQNKMINNC